MLTQSVWRELKDQWSTPLIAPKPIDPMAIALCKKVANAVKPIFVIVAMLFALIATPALMAIDLPLSLCGVNMEAKTVLEFYQGGRNDKGVTLEDIWAFDDAALEAKHDFIQWLFPLKLKGVNPTAPLTTNETTTAFKASPKLQSQMRKSFGVMLAFYGLEEKSNRLIEKASSFNQKAKNWLNPGNHNYRRITRILHSMKLHGLEKEAGAFLKVLERIYSAHSSQIGSSTISYWRGATAAYYFGILPSFLYNRL